MNEPKIVKWNFLLADARRVRPVEDVEIMLRVLSTLKPGEHCTEITEDNLPARVYYPGEGWV